MIVDLNICYCKAKVKIPNFSKPRKVKAVLENIGRKLSSLLDKEKFGLQISFLQVMGNPSILIK